MKRCSFISIVRKYNQNDIGYTYNIVYDIKPNGEFSELVGSLNKFEKIEIVDFKNLQSDVNLFISFFCMDRGDYFNTIISELFESINCKTLFLDFASYDNQEISEEELDNIQSLTDKPIYFITKNLLQNRNNHLFFEELCYHTISENSQISKFYNAYTDIKVSQKSFWRNYKAFCYTGHTRVHKVKFLEFLYQNKYLDEIIWSCTGLDFDPEIIRELIPIEYEEEFNSFEILNHIPKLIDFDLNDKNNYTASGVNPNFITYLDTCFEIVPETRFYDQSGKEGSTITYKSWNNISEKIIKPTLLGHPFILLSKPNTIKSLKERGVDYEYDFWKFDYDTIEDNEDRMIAIQEFTHKVMNMSIKELSEFNNDYYQKHKKNHKNFIEGVYIKPINDIWNKL
jgi:hypothetical protein